jgi:hypothetical protein
MSKVAAHYYFSEWRKGESLDLAVSKEKFSELPKRHAACVRRPRSPPPRSRQYDAAHSEG